MFSLNLICTGLFSKNLSIRLVNTVFTNTQLNKRKAEISWSNWILEILKVNFGNLKILFWKFANFDNLILEIWRFWQFYFGNLKILTILFRKFENLILKIWFWKFDFEILILKFWFWNFDFEILILKFWFWKLWNFDFAVFFVISKRWILVLVDFILFGPWNLCLTFSSIIKLYFPGNSKNPADNITNNCWYIWFHQNC